MQGLHRRLVILLMLSGTATAVLYRELRKAHPKPNSQLISIAAERAQISISQLVGVYECQKYDKQGKNKWHYVTIKISPKGNLIWSNRAGVEWLIIPTNESRVFRTGVDYPYKDRRDIFSFRVNKLGVVEGVYGPGKEFYKRKGRFSDSP